jgi:hypothetical protein
VKPSGRVQGRGRVGVVAAMSVLAVAGTSLAPAVASGAATPKGRVVAANLDNPRGLSFGASGVLYVAEAGHGGPLCLAPGPEGSPLCVGLTGAVSRVRSDGRVVRLVTGLVSTADAKGQAAEGPVSVSARHGRVYAVIGESARGLPPKTPTGPVMTAARHQLGRQIRLTGHGRYTPVAPVGDIDYLWSAAHKKLNPQFPDANPNAILAVAGGAYVADAGANTLDWVSSAGMVKVLAYLNVPKGAPVDSVPTCVAKGPDGALYIGELLGGYLIPGHARVWRYSHGTARVWKTGLTAVNGCGFDSRGNFYATEIFANGLTSGSPIGALVQIAKNGHRSIWGAGQLFAPSGFAVKDDDVYVSNWSVMPAKNLGGPTGQVMTFDIG